ncbi:MAG: DUF4185 domain-containing protein [Verrucomicrobiota bacterium]
MFRSMILLIASLGMVVAQSSLCENSQVLRGPPGADGVPPAIKFTSQAAPELDAQFQNTNGWIGADGAFSIPLSDDKTLWLFSDTWVGEIREGKRLHPVLINNSIALQRRGAMPELVYPTNQGGRAEALVKPQDGVGHFWLFHAFRGRDGLFLFLHQIKTTDSKSAFGFKTVGVSIGVVSNPDEAPALWKIVQTKLPFTEILEKESLLFGSAVMKDGEFVYIYGNSSRSEPGKRGLVVARVREDEFMKFDAWRFFSNGKWVRNFHDATPISPDAPSENSVWYQSSLKKYVTVYSQGIGGKILLRTAAAPTGPWSEAQTIFECPEMKWSPKVFCYAGKAHPEIATRPDEIIVTYAANSHDFMEVLGNARLYWPRFIRVKLSPD